jgi:hypothetical protein
MRSEWLKSLLKFIIPATMSDKNDQVQFHASSTGRLYIKEDEFFKTSKVKGIIRKLLNSSIYKDIKKKETPNVSH